MAISNYLVGLEYEFAGAGLGLRVGAVAAYQVAVGEELQRLGHVGCLR